MTRKDARKTILKAKIYRGLAMLFAIGGLIAFSRVYFTEIEGHLLEVVHRPWILIALLMPFLPAVTLSWYARRIEQHLFKIMKNNHHKRAA